MTKWELARYLIDAKKNVDSVLYISEHGQELSNINLRDKINNIRRSFFINCCVVLDKSVKKKEICASDKVIDSIYRERDKNGAHKDEDYQPKEYTSIYEIADEMKAQIIKVRKVCAESLPDCITLDFVPHDRELFRLVNGVNSNAEEIINKTKYPLRNTPITISAGFSKRIFHDTEDIRKIPESEKSDYAVVFENGINQYEGIQNRQDSCILVNVLYGQNIWCSVNSENFAVVEKWTKLGMIDTYGRPVPIEGLSESALEEIKRIAEEAGIKDE
ncbi:MAG: hypothetical protein IKS90_00175 [Clostridia bacterium]|nr:hypothetical protein [Clostridia bacterium]